MDLQIPKKYRRIGLYVYCNKCKGYSNIKTGILRKTEKCHHPYESQVYKIRVHKPGTKRNYKALVLITKNVKEAEQQRLLFIKLLKEHDYNLASIETENRVDIYSMPYQIDKFLRFLDNEDVPEHLQIHLSKGTINDYERNFKYFFESLIRSKISVNSIKVTEITDKYVGIFHSYLINKPVSNKTYNNIMSSLNVFFKHMIEHEHLSINNPFLNVQRKHINYKPLTFTSEEFEKILQVMTPENGCDKKKRNHYKPWLVKSYKLAAYSCLRLEELVYLKYSEIRKSDETGYLMIEAENIKVNNLKGYTRTEEKVIKEIPVINEMLRVLMNDFDFKNNQNTDQYVIAPKLSRSNVYNIIGKSFTHFKRKAGINDEKCFKDLRTTFITQLQLTYNDPMLTKAISNHAGTDVILKHYFDKQRATKVAKSFTVFGNSSK